MKNAALAALAVAAIGAPAMAQQLSITVENTQASGGFAFTPFWFGFHDGSFDVFTTGQAASGGITEIAELGDTGPLSSRFSSEQASGVQATFLDPNGPPVFSAGESATTSINVGDASVNRYFNYASMVVPTNDLFVGNGNAIELFDASGNFNGPLTIEIYGRNVYDAGTEVNDITNGAAFIAGLDATLGADENSVVRAFFSDAGDSAYIDSILGTQTAPGPLVTTGFGEATLLGRITITPAPGTALPLAVCGLAAARRRRG